VIIICAVVLASCACLLSCEVDHVQTGVLCSLSPLVVGIRLDQIRHVPDWRMKAPFLVSAIKPTEESRCTRMTCVDGKPLVTMADRLGERITAREPSCLPTPNTSMGPVLHRDRRGEMPLPTNTALLKRVSVPR
jgi:hypothetical protein